MANGNGSFELRLALAIVALGVAAAAGAKTHLQAGGGVVSHDCGDDPAVEIDGTRAEVRLTGACEKIDISGTNLTVRAEGVGKVEISGLSNTLEWQYATGGRSRPSVEQNGVGHRVVKVEAKAAAGEPAAASQTAPATKSPSTTGDGGKGRATIDASSAGGSSSVRMSATGAGAAAAATSPVAGATLALEAETSTVGVEKGSGGIRITGHGIRRRIDCGGSKVQILGDDVVALLLGDCPNVQVAGDRGEVWIERVDQLQILGAGSQAFYVGSTDGDRVNVSLVGAGATARAVSAAELAERRKR